MINIKNKYMVKEIINNGNFGTIAKGYKIKDNKDIVVKFDKSEINIIKHETFILNYLSSKNVKFIPNVIYYGIYNDVPILILPYYKYNLQEFININNEHTSEFYISFIKKLISIIEHIHSNLVIHRDIKPENIMINNNEPILIDFGLSCFYYSHNGEHILNNNISQVVGSYKYSSIHVN